MYLFVAIRKVNANKQLEAQNWSKRVADCINKNLKATGVEFIRPMTAWTVHIGDRSMVWWTAVAKDVATLEKWREELSKHQDWQKLHDEGIAQGLWADISEQMILKAIE